MAAVAAGAPVVLAAPLIITKLAASAVEDSTDSIVAVMAALPAMTLVTTVLVVSVPLQ